ncbi:MAG TPA: cell division protein FtsZ [Nevskiales bacterium]|nr:cell division protein FtsZ [Nevskiales bacterium]
MSEKFEIIDGTRDGAVIKVIGVGGGGSNTVNQMVEAGIDGVEFICANTDAQHLDMCKADVLLPLGANVTRGLGAGADPAVGKQAALEDRERIREALHGADMLFITAGMGGGTGTGAAPVVAEIAKEMQILTVAVVTKPFSFERAKRMEVAMQGIQELSQHVDSLIVIPNEKLFQLGKSITLKSAFKAANDVLQNAVQGIADLITRPGLINVDFADVRRVMSIQGMAMMGLGAARGDNRAQVAAQTALASPLLEDLDLTGAQGVLVNVTSDENLTQEEFKIINELIAERARPDAWMIVGTAFDAALQDELRVTVVATGLGGMNKLAATPVKPPRRSDGTLDMKVIEKPAIVRKHEQAHRTEGATALDLDYLDVPAFLRHQAD